MTDRTVNCDADGLRCHFETELSCLCPVVDEPDDYAVVVSWTPNGSTLEIHELQQTVASYHGVERMQEEIARSLYHDLALPGIAELRVSLRNRRHDYEVIAE